jgi:hypothetical protein
MGAGVLAQACLSLLPKGLYARALLTVIAPMVILQCVLTYVFSWSAIGSLSRSGFRLP